MQTDVYVWYLTSNEIHDSTLGNTTSSFSYNIRHWELSNISIGESGNLLRNYLAMEIGLKIALYCIN